jgi:hypothetical protein
MLRAKCKNSIQKFIVFLSLVVFITANIGMAVYTHTCSIAGTEKSLFLSYEDPCGDDHPVKKKTCCTKDIEEETHVENSCCSTDKDYVALDIDTRVEKFEVKPTLTAFILEEVVKPVFYTSPEIECTNRLQPEYSNLPPPKYQGRDFQSINQVYLI